MSIAFDDSSADSPAAGLDLTPMIDVTFLLIIFWIVVTSVAPDEPVAELELPHAAVAESATAGRPINIDVTAGPVRPIFFAGQWFSPGELSEHLSSRPLAGRAVVLRADRRADSAVISQLARDCYRHGAGSVAFSLQASEP